MPVSGSRRLMSIRTSAEFDADAMVGDHGRRPAGGGDLLGPVLDVSQAQAGTQPDPQPFPGRGRAGRQDQRQAAGAVGDDELAETGADAVPADQAPGHGARCRAVTGPIAAGTPTIAAVMMSRGASVVCPASSTQPMSRPPVTASSGSHHQMARSTGHAATMAAMMHAGTRPISPPVIRARMPAPVAPSFGSHLLTSTVAASRADSGPDDEEDDLRLADVGPHDRLLDDRHGSRAAAERQAAIRLGHDATSFCRVGCVEREFRRPGPGLGGMRLLQAPAA